MNISLEAREAAWEYIKRIRGFDMLEYGQSEKLKQSVMDGAGDDDPLTELFQSLINSTLERAAGVAENYKQLGYMSDRERDYCHQHGEEVSVEIRRLIGGE